MTKTKTILLLSFIVALGLFIRVWNINNTPPGVYPDEAVNGIDAINAMHGQWQWFYPANNGREGLFMNMIAVCFKLFGISVLTLKLPSIIFGTLTIWGTYLLAKELFQSRRTGLISAFLTAVGFWAINFSRISFRANTLPTILAFSFYFLWKGMRTRKWYDFAFGGLIFGLGLHTYISFRIAPLILVVMLVTLIISRKNFIKDYWKTILIFCLFAAIAAAPMLYTFFIAHPEYWQSRTSEISILNPEVNHGHILATFFKTFSLSLLKYTFWGDQNWRHNFPPYGILDPITGIAFMFGFVYSIIRLFHLLIVRFRSSERNPRLEVYIFLVSWFFIMIVPEFMAAEGNPHALRSIGTLPAVFIFSALTFNYFFERAERHGGMFRKVSKVILVFMLLVIGTFNIVKYHFVWAKKQVVAESFDKNLMDISAYLKTLPPGEQKFVVAEVMERIPIQLFTQDAANTEFVYHGQIDYITPADNNFEIIMTDNDADTVALIKEKFPNLNYQYSMTNYQSVL
jgi:4-amino-4-deoxy-L-arabinose transferase-like glycosyltransferase